MKAKFLIPVLFAITLVIAIYFGVRFYGLQTEFNTYKISRGPCDGGEPADTIQANGTSTVVVYDLADRSKGLPGVEVCVYMVDETATDAEPKKISCQRTNERGMCSFDGLEPGLEYLITTQTPEGLTNQVVTRQELDVWDLLAIPATCGKVNEK